jgi:translation initiation factor 2 alpha subunit (eIF-2alpha)
MMKHLESMRVDYEDKISMLEIKDEITEKQEMKLKQYQKISNILEETLDNLQNTIEALYEEMIRV